MSFPFLAWNPINLIDGESHWILWEVIFVLIALMASKFLNTTLNHIAKRVNNPSFTIFADAVYTPVIYLIWYLLVLYTFDLVTDELLSKARPRAWAILVNGGSVLFFGWFLLRLKNRLLDNAIAIRTQEGRIPEAHSMQAVSKLFTAIIGIIILVLLNDFAGMSFTTLLAFGGVGGLALAFASQEIVSNFFGGFMVHMTRSFLIGEQVSIPSINVDGVVEEIGWYQTRLRPQTKTAVYIPNSLFSKALLINKTRITHRLIDEPAYLTISPLTSLTNIIDDVDAYFASHPLLERAESVGSRTWVGSRIESVGPISSIVVYGLTRTTSLQDYYRLRGEVLLNVSAIIVAHGGELALPPNVLK
jgi:MscS family membrane protein